MRFTTIAFALIGFLAFGDLTYAQGTVSPGNAPKPLTAPVGHRQPRQSDIANSQADTQAGTNASPTAPAANPPGPSDQDARLNRILNGICRGC